MEEQENLEVEDNKITVEDEEGNKFDIEILFSYEDPDTEKTYVYLLDYTDDSIAIGEYLEDGSINLLGPETPEELQKKLQDVYADYVRQYNARVESEENN